MFGNMIQSFLPPGVTVESLTAVAQGLASKMVQLAADVDTIKQTQAEQGAMLRQIMALCQSISDAQGVQTPQGATNALQPLDDTLSPDELGSGGIANASPPGQCQSFNGNTSHGFCAEHACGTFGCVAKRD